MQVPFYQSEGGNISVVAITPHQLFITVDGKSYIVDNPSNPNPKQPVPKTIYFDGSMTPEEIKESVSDATGIPHTENPTEGISPIALQIMVKAYREMKYKNKL